MCDYFSCIITSDFKVHWSKKTVNHEDILTEIRQEDKKLEQRNFVRIEILPKDKRKLTRNPDDWAFKIDEERTLPDWYEQNVVKCQKLCWQAWTESTKINLAIDKETIVTTEDLVFASGSATVEASGSATVRAYDSATVRTYDSATVRTYDSATVEAYGSATVRAYDSATVRAYDSATVELKSNSAVVLCHGKIIVTTEAIVLRSSKIIASEV